MRLRVVACLGVAALGCGLASAAVGEPTTGSDAHLDDSGTVAIDPATQVLRIGSTGPAVRDLQRELRRRGSRVVVDGRFGLGTKRAVQRLQRRFGITPSGVANAPFLARLGITVRQVAAESSVTALRFQGAVPSFVWPAAGPINSPYGYRWGRMHEGIDIGAKSGSPTIAAAAGTVTFAGWEGAYGNLVIVDHGGGVETAYAHLSAIAVADDQRVLQGEKLGDVGSTGRSTGPHLHFEVRLNENPYNPLTYLPPTSPGADIQVTVTPTPTTTGTTSSVPSAIAPPAPAPAPEPAP